MTYFKTPEVNEKNSKQCAISSMNHTHKKQRFLVFQSQTVHKKNAGAINPEFKLQMMESWHIYQRLFNLV